jgi:hypothetical protein
MPRLRRAARERRQRPQLALGVWQVISGQKTYEELTERDKWNYLILRGDAAYWARIREAVADGSIEISAEKDHYANDPPLS